MSRNLNACARARFLTLLLALAFALAPGAALAGDSAEDAPKAMGKEGGLGAGAAVASLLYAPIKLVYATGGLVVGGLAWAFSGGDSEVAKTILTPSVRGDYVITPDQLRGKRNVEFFGRRPEYRTDSTDVYADTGDGW